MASYYADINRDNRNDLKKVTILPKGRIEAAY